MGKIQGSESLMSYDLWEYGLRVPAMFKTPRTLPVDAKREREREREQIRKIQGCCCLDELEFWIPSKSQVGAVIVETWGEILGQLACETWAPGKDMDWTWRGRMISKTESFGKG